MPDNLSREFPNREALANYLRETFPEVAARDDHIAPTRGGRQAGLQRLQSIRPQRYAKTRNYLDGDVTGLSPYIRHRVLSLVEVRDHAVRQANHPNEVSKFINELAWHDYWQRVYDVVGNDVWKDLEPWKAGHTAADYAAELPPEISSGETGLACMDGFAHELAATGYLHNHARMWVAAYVVHFRQVRWQAGAQWFLEHLLDGDPASNNLSWQWVASTFGHKPYIFNRENLEKFTGGVYCRECPLSGRCDFEGSYDDINARLFPPNAGGGGAEKLPRQNEDEEFAEKPLATNGKPPVLWIHADGLNPESRLLREYPGAPAIFVWDDEQLARDGWTLKRVMFIYECLLEMPVVIRRGKTVDELQQFAAEHDSRQLATSDSPDPRFKQTMRQLERTFTTSVCRDKPFVDPDQPLPLERFSRYWRKAERCLT